MILKTLAVLSSLLQHSTTGDCGPNTCESDEELGVTKLETLVNVDQLKLETLVDQLKGQVSELATAGVEMEAELATSQKIIKSLLDECSGKWKWKRTQMVFPKLEKLALSGDTPTFVETMPATLPDNTRAVIVQVFCNFGEGASTDTNTDAYLDVEIQQEGNEEGGAARVENTHHHNTSYYEVLVPWDHTISDKLQFKVRRSYESDGPDNWYRLRVVGYILV